MVPKIQEQYATNFVAAVPGRVTSGRNEVFRDWANITVCGGRWIKTATLTFW
jgi:hypothetical protein